MFDQSIKPGRSSKLFCVLDQSCKVGFLRDGKLRRAIFVSNGYTSNFICTSPSDTSLEAKWYQDFHQIFSHRHFYSTKWDTFRQKNRILSFFERFTGDNLNFLCTFPIPPTGVLENAKNRFKFGLLFPVYWNKSSKSRKCHLSKNRL